MLVDQGRPRYGTAAPTGAEARFSCRSAFIDSAGSWVCLAFAQAWKSQQHSSRPSGRATPSGPRSTDTGITSDSPLDLTLHCQIEKPGDWLNRTKPSASLAGVTDVLNLGVGSAVSGTRSHTSISRATRRESGPVV